jgi:hypothetical protein
MYRSVYFCFPRNLWPNGLGTWSTGSLSPRREENIPVGAIVISLICKISIIQLNWLVTATIGRIT